MKQNQCWPSGGDRMQPPSWTIAAWKERSTFLPHGKIPESDIISVTSLEHFVTWKQSKHTDASLWALSVSFYRCCWRRTNVWRWSSPEPSWHWPRLRWRRTRCCTAWRASKSTPARPGSLSLSLSLSLHPQPFKSLIRPPAGLQSEELKGRGVSGIIKGKKGDFVTKMAPFTRFFVEWAAAWL